MERIAAPAPLALRFQAPPATRTTLVWPALVTLAALLPAAPAARAEEAASPFSGYFMLYDYVDLTRALDEAGFLAHEYPDKEWFATDRAGLRLQLRANGELSEKASFDATVQFDYDVRDALRQPTSSVTDGMSFQLKEGFLAFSRVLPVLDLKLGRQYVFWGRFEWGGVLDGISGWDYNSMGAEKENFRLAVDAARVLIDLSPVTIEGIWLPWFAPNRTPLALPDKLGPLPVEQRPADVPSLAPENSEGGARVLLDMWGYGEVALSYFNGFQRTFYLEPTTINDPDTGFVQGLAFTPKYQRQHTLGLDFEIPVGPVLLLGEAGWFLTEDRDGTDVWKRNPSAAGVLGFEMEPHSRLMIQAQAAYTRLLDYNRQYDYDTRVAFGEPDPFVPSQDQYQLTYRLRYRIVSELSFHWLHLFNRHDRTTWDMMMLGFFSWEPLEALKVYAGGIVFRGEENIGFGRLEDQGRLFVEIRQYF